MSRPTSEMQLAQLQSQVQQLQQQMMQLQRLAAVGELLSTTTHEFNNVLTTILNFAKMARRQRDEATRDRALDKIVGAAERAARITHGILGMARNRSNQLEPTDLELVVRDTMTLVERDFTKYRIAVDLQLEPVPKILAHASQLQQLLLNLLINARQAIGERGQVLIRLRHDRQNGRVELTVRDSGPGIPEDKLPMIFEPFFTTKSGPDASGKGGTGLGLAACKQIVQAHHGTIRVATTVGRGTAFTIRLPIGSDSASADPAAA